MYKAADTINDIGRLANFSLLSPGLKGKVFFLENALFEEGELLDVVAENLNLFLCYSNLIFFLDF